MFQYALCRTNRVCPQEQNYVNKIHCGILDLSPDSTLISDNELKLCVILSVQ